MSPIGIKHVKPPTQQAITRAVELLRRHAHQMAADATYEHGRAVEARTAAHDLQSVADWLDAGAIGETRSQ